MRQVRAVLGSFFQKIKLVFGIIFVSLCFETELFGASLRQYSFLMLSVSVVLGKII